MKKNTMIIFATLLTISLVLSNCSTKTTPNAPPSTNTTGGSVQSPSNTAETPVSPENNPPGDIPDTQVFVNYTSAAGGYQLQVPEGWARTEKGTDVAFANNYDGVKVEVISVSYTLSSDNIKNNYVAALEKNGRAVTVNSINDVKLKNLPAVKLSFSSNSDPDPVTNKQIRLENESYFFIKDGKMAVMSFWAPYGADNVDQWKLMSDSFSWK